MALVRTWRNWLKVIPAEGTFSSETGSSWLKCLMGESARKGMVTLADQAVTSATNFLTGVIIGRTLLKADFGLYMLGFTIVLFSMSMQTSLILAPYTVYSPRLQGLDHRLYTGSALIHQMFLSALAMICLVVGGVLTYLGLGPQGLGSVVWVLAGVILFILLKDYLRQTFFAQLRLYAAFWLDLSVALIQLGWLLLLVRVGWLTPGHAFGVVGAACAIPTVGYLLIRRHSFQLSLAQAWRSFKQNWPFIKWSVASAITAWLLSQIYPWFLAFFHDNAAVGVLAACWSLVFITNPFLRGMTNLLNPLAAHAFSQGGPKKMNRLIYLFSFLLLLFMVTFCLIIFFKGGWLLLLFYGPKYAGNGHLVFLLAIGYLFTNVTIPLCCGLMAAEMPDLVFKSYVVGVVSTFLLGIPLVRAHGIIGVAISLIANAITVALFRVWAFRVYMKRQKNAEIIYGVSPKVSN